MRKWVFAASLCLAAAIAFLWFDVDWAVTQRQKHAPKPDELVLVGGISMTQENALLTRIYPRDKVGAFRHALLARRNLFPLIYILCGLAGACAAVWLLLVKDGFTAKATNWDRAGAAVLLSALAGLIAYLLVKASSAASNVDLMKAYDDWEVFPVLAGAFNTVFYDALPGVLTSIIDMMKKKWKPVVVLVLLGPALMPGSARAQTAKTDANESAYYKCSDPSTCKCWAFTKKEQDACKECKTWQSVSIDDRVLDILRATDPAQYNNHASKFARDASAHLFDMKLDDTSASVSNLYSHPADFGFKEVSSADAAPTTLVVYPKLAGVVANAEGDIAYPSEKRQTLNVTTPAALKKEGQPKYLVPANAVAPSKE